MKRPNNRISKICVIGLGYVGLPTAAVFASRGISVLGVDINPDAVGAINQGRAHFFEPDLDKAVNDAVSTGKLKAAAVPAAADAFIIAVPTPFKEGRKPDLDHVRAAVAEVAKVLVRGNLVIIESTCPVGTTDAVSRWLASARPDLVFPHQDGDGVDVHIAHSPERVLPGRVLQELVANDRVIGGLTHRCALRAAALYRLAVDGECVLTTAATAELVKLSENAYRDVNIAFANELSLIADRLGIDVWQAIDLANRHPRVNILRPGPGVGGHCIAVDPWFIVDSAPGETDLIQAARKVNLRKPVHVAALVRDACAGIAAPVVACLGLAYKADIDDLRQSPAVEIVRLLAGGGDDGDGLKADLRVVEPHIDALPDELAKAAGVRLLGLEEALDGATVVVLLTDHREFRLMDTRMLEGAAIIDTRGAWRK